LKGTGSLWVFRAVGVVIVLVGAYLAGGVELACVSVSPRLGAECRAETRRWLGKSVVAQSAYAAITRAETIMVRQTGQDAEDAWFVGLFAGDAEAGRVFGERKRVHEARERLRAWLEGGMRGEMRVVWSSWPFGSAAMAFGLIVFTVAAVASRRKARPSR
jgi:hypothetical protein